MFIKLAFVIVSLQLSCIPEDTFSSVLVSRMRYVEDRGLLATDMHHV